MFLTYIFTYDLDSVLWHVLTYILIFDLHTMQWHVFDLYFDLWPGYCAMFSTYILTYDLHTMLWHILDLCSDLEHVFDLYSDLWRRYYDMTCLRKHFYFYKYFSNLAGKGTFNRWMLMLHHLWSLCDKLIALPKLLFFHLLYICLELDCFRDEIEQVWI